MHMNELIELRRHLGIVHHVPGRIRVRLGTELQDRIGGLNPQDIKDFLLSLDGIDSIRVNPMAASVVVQYDADRFPPAMWECLLAGPDDRAMELAETLVQTYS